MWWSGPREARTWGQGRWETEGVGSCEQVSAIFFPELEYPLQGWNTDADFDSDGDWRRGWPLRNTSFTEQGQIFTSTIHKSEKAKPVCKGKWVRQIRDKTNQRISLKCVSINVKSNAILQVTKNLLWRIWRILPLLLSIPQIKSWERNRDASCKHAKVPRDLATCPR